MNKDRIKGALYGFAIGDAMGATTEFVDRKDIKRPVVDIVGGGWLHLKPGEVTDDTELMLEVADALSITHATEDPATILRLVCFNLISWYQRNPKDVGAATARAIFHAMVSADPTSPANWAKEDNKTLGNGSLMRALYPLLFYHGTDPDFGLQIALDQSDLTHNNKQTRFAIRHYNKLLQALLKGKIPEDLTGYKYLMEPTGHVTNTLNNAIVHFLKMSTVEDSLIEAVNNGGDADTIAAITGSLAGAYYGYSNIPKRWIKQLRPDVRAQLEKYYGIILRRANDGE